MKYWADRGHLYCKHGVILYGTKCVQCEREPDLHGEMVARKLAAVLKWERKR